MTADLARKWGMLNGRDGTARIISVELRHFVFLVIGETGSRRQRYKRSQSASKSSVSCPKRNRLKPSFAQKKISSTFVTQKKNAVDVVASFGSVFLRRRRRRRLLLSGGTTQVHALQRESQRRSHR